MVGSNLGDIGFHFDIGDTFRMLVPDANVKK